MSEAVTAYQLGSCVTYGGIATGLAYVLLGLSFNLSLVVGTVIGSVGMIFYPRPPGMIGLTAIQLGLGVGLGGAVTGFAYTMLGLSFEISLDLGTIFGGIVLLILSYMTPSPGTIPITALQLGLGIIFGGVITGSSYLVLLNVFEISLYTGTIAGGVALVGASFGPPGATLGASPFQLGLAVALGGVSTGLTYVLLVDINISLVSGTVLGGVVLAIISFFPGSTTETTGPQLGVAIAIGGIVTGVAVLFGGLLFGPSMVLGTIVGGIVLMGLSFFSTVTPLAAKKKKSKKGK